MARQFGSGALRVRLTVDAGGKLIRHEFFQAAREETKHRRCGVFAGKPTFPPAHDIGGRPVLGQYFASVCWAGSEITALCPREAAPDLALEVAALPRGKGVAFANLRIILDTDGRAVHCAINTPASEPEFNRAACPLVLANNRFDAVRDQDGKPSRAVMTLRVAFVLKGQPVPRVYPAVF